MVFRILKRLITEDTIVAYQKGNCKKGDYECKKKEWKEFCNTIRRETEMHVVWRMIMKMSGINKQIPIIEEKGKLAITNKEKAEVFTITFTKTHSTENLDKFFFFFFK